MSKDNVKQMFGKMEKDEALKGKYADLMQAHQKDAENKMAEKLIELGKTSGFAFSKDDLLAARAELTDKANSNNELSDGDLASVAGGMLTQKGTMALISVFTAGIYCALASIMNESAVAGGCGACLTTVDKC